MAHLRKPLIFALIGGVAGAIGFGMSALVGIDLQASFVTIVLAGAFGGLIGGWLRQRRGK